MPSHRCCLSGPPGLYFFRVSSRVLICHLMGNSHGGRTGWESRQAINVVEANYFSTPDNAMGRDGNNGINKSSAPAEKSIRTLYVRATGPPLFFSGPLAGVSTR